MTSIDYTDARQVFNRLAQIQHDTMKRLQTISDLNDAQNQADREFDLLQRITLAYLAPKDFPVVPATAYEERQYVRHSIDYCLTVINNSVVVKRSLSIWDIGDLSDDEIRTALDNPE